MSFPALSLAAGVLLLSGCAGTVERRTVEAPCAPAPAIDEEAPPGEYYLRLEEACRKMPNKNWARTCCEKSVQRMRQDGYRSLQARSCPEGYGKSRLYCQGSHTWCESLDRAREKPRHHYPCGTDAACAPCGEGCLPASVAPYADCLEPTHNDCRCVAGLCRRN
ncbi:MAG: hypothetical protein ABIJ96_05745 [Elusimicrobiota bacterium]